MQLYRAQTFSDDPSPTLTNEYLIVAEDYIAAREVLVTHLGMPAEALFITVSECYPGSQRMIFMSLSYDST